MPVALSVSEILPSLELWPQTRGGTAELINYSENQIFRVTAPNGMVYCLRVHRVGYQSRPTINSELAWLMALRRDTGLPIPEPLPGFDGCFLQAFETSSGEPRLGVLFHYVHGVEPQPTDRLDGLFENLGGFAARLHRHAESWDRPVGFQRQAWQADTILNADGLWGDWRRAPGVDATIRPVLDRLDSVLWSRLAAYGNGPDRYGLIHADMRLGNLLVQGDHVTLIDFDDCGFCWFAYDFAAAVSFYETDPRVPDLKAAWLTGYQRIRGLSPADIEFIDSMIMLRRMALLAWIGSHADTRLAQTHMPGYAAGTAMLAERYFKGPLWP